MRTPSANHVVWLENLKRPSPVHKASHFARVGEGRLLYATFSLFFAKKVVFTIQTRDFPVTKEQL